MTNDRAGLKTATVPKLCGADVELGNFVLGVDRVGGTGWEASLTLLREIRRAAGMDGEPASASGWYRAADTGSSTYRYEWQPTVCRDPQDWGRTFLATNGGCVYIDLEHLELCLPEVLSAYDHVAAWHAMLRIAQQALVAANARRPHPSRIEALVNNSDGMGNAYGSHLDFLVTREAWENLTERKLHHLAQLVAHQVSSIVFTGQGKVGSENGTPPVVYQISQRADFFETLTGLQTTYRRPLVNTRDEPLCGSMARDLARLHVIFFDNTLCHVASLLKVGVTQIVLAMLEAGRVNVALALDEPLAALRVWSRDPLLEARARLADGKAVTAVELQMLLLEDARRFVLDGGCEGIVPRARDILMVWEDTLLALEARDWAKLARRLDWVLKLSLLSRAQQTQRGVGWDSAAAKRLDHLYASLDPGEGLYWALERSRLVDVVVSDTAIERLRSDPPSDTRAWGRAMLLRRAPANAVVDVDWDTIRVRLSRRRGSPIYGAVKLPDPLGATSELLLPVFQRHERFHDLVNALGADWASWSGSSSGAESILPPLARKARTAGTSRWGRETRDSDGGYDEVP